MKHLLPVVGLAVILITIPGCIASPPKKDGTALLNGDAVMQLGAMPKKIVADFWLNDSSESCKNFRNAGYVYDWDTENSGWLDNAARRLSRSERDEVKFIATAIPSGHAIQVAALNQGHEASCGPVFAQFAPLKAHQYQAYFVMWEEDCRMEIVDTTDPDNQVLANGFKPIHCVTPEGIQTSRK